MNGRPKRARKTRVGETGVWEEESDHPTWEQLDRVLDLLERLVKLAERDQGQMRRNDRGF